MEYSSAAISYANVSTVSLVTRKRALYSGSLSFFLVLCGVVRNEETLYCWTMEHIRIMRSSKETSISNIE
jgi:hypothetical protein